MSQKTRFADGCGYVRSEFSNEVSVRVYIRNAHGLQLMVNVDQIHKQFIVRWHFAKLPCQNPLIWSMTARDGNDSGPVQLAITLFVRSVRGLGTFVITLSHETG